MIIRVIDTETTGIDENAKLVEVAWVDLLLDQGIEGDIRYPAQHFVDPQIPIPAEVSAIHHITDNDVKGAILAGKAIEFARITNETNTPVYAAHNAEFDKRFLGGLSGEWICTYRCALHVWPDAPRHSNQVLRYWLRLEGPPAGSGHAHRALYDAYTTAQILREMMKIHPATELIEMSTKPALLSKVTFGKHKGENWGDVPKSYLNWMKSQKEWDMDIKHTIEHYLK